MNPELQAYLDEHSIETIFKEILAVIIREKPTDPIEFTIQSLQQLQNQPKSIDFKQFFQQSYRSYSMNPVQFSPDSFSLPNFNKSRRCSVSSEPFVPCQDYEPTSHETFPKTDEERKLILQGIRSNFLMKNLESDQIDQIINAMFPVQVKASDVVIRQNEPGDNFYIVQHGNLDIFVNDIQVSVATDGSCFGELALLYNTPRAATIIAREDSSLWALDRFTFRKMLANNVFQKRQLYLTFLRSVPLFESLSNDELVRIADALEPCEFTQGTPIVQQNVEGDKFFIVIEGEVEITIANDGITKHMGTLKRGDYFGEIAMLTKAPRHATVTAISEKVQCISLEADAFTRLLGPIEEILKRNMENYQKYEEYIQ